jgi:deazaflavin-dependent oxidoreductase (nitroreductase family)
MPFPRWLARVNLRFTNRILGPLACRMPGMGVVVHFGRKTHRRYRTPVMVFQRGNGFIIALTYGADSQWVQNVLTANGCEMEMKSHLLRLSQPKVLHDEQRKTVPAFVRPFLGILNVSDFLELMLAENQTS